MAYKISQLFQASAVKKISVFDVYTHIFPPSLLLPQWRSYKPFIARKRLFTYKAARQDWG